MKHRYEYRTTVNETPNVFIIIDNELPEGRNQVCYTDNIVHARNIAACLNLVHCDSLAKTTKEEWNQ